jgi:hypothetical protein
MALTDEMYMLMQTIPNIDLNTAKRMTHCEMLMWLRKAVKFREMRKKQEENK